MTSIFDAEALSPKVMSLGESGTAKTSSEVALVCGGWKLRKIDSDNGWDVLRGLLTHPKYPYGEICRKRGINLETAIDFQVVDTKMKFTTVMRKEGDKFIAQRLYAPANADAWPRVTDLLDNWPGAGPLDTWEKNVVLSIDSGSTIAQQAYYFQQHMNGRLGASEEGYDYQRDIGGAQTQVRRLLEGITSKDIHCAVNFITHIRKVDTESGFARSPSELARQNLPADPKGYPNLIGVALAPKASIRFNNMLVYKREGGGMSTRRFISTLPIDNVDVKTSTWLESQYPVSSGLYEIFESLAGREPDPELVAEMRGGASGGGINLPPPSGLNLPTR
jgi:hypothetical protein